MPEFDLVVTGGDLLDGTGSPAVPADVGVRGDRIAAVAAPGTLPGAETLDATGHVVAPGFIDLHSHADFSIQGHPGADTCLYQGVTTLVGGNCGFSPFPVADPESLRRSAAFMEDELLWDWTGFDGYATVVERSKPAVNLVAQVGLNALRMAAVGGDERPATPEERTAMRVLLERAADEGVAGFSTGLIYAPGSYAPPHEVTELARAAARLGLLYSTHMRNEADRLIDAVTEALTTARESGVRLEISHLKAMGRANHGGVHEALRLIDEARAQGVDVTADVYPYTASSTTLTSRLPGWAMDGGVERLLERLSDAGTRRRIAAGTHIDADAVVLAELPPGPYSAWIGRSLAELGGELGLSGAETALEVIAAHHGSVGIVDHAMSEDDVRAVLSHPHVGVASDGWVLRPAGGGRPHPRSFGTFARVLGRYVREWGVLTLADAVRKMTSLPASRAGLADRGEVREGLAADLAVLDPRTVVDTSTFDDPWKPAAGVRHVVVNGTPVLRDAVLTGKRPGRVLRRHGA
ncbi:MAG: N-acyl-D-amino-acid deacylase [Actinoallomurus sp.]|nr:N-acyl-D-amino-acid deacylase [Actinoallomurus sp.]